MRTLYEIIEDCKNNGRPDYEELRYALLVINFLWGMDHRNLRQELLSDKRADEFIRYMKAQNSFDAAKSAFNTSPKEYLGADDPANPDYQRHHQMFVKLFEKAYGKTDSKPTITSSPDHKAAEEFKKNT